MRASSGVLKAFVACALAAVPAASGWAAAPANDTDLDGVADFGDAFPCDWRRTAVSFVPGELDFATLMLEDNWPARGDLDFNDAVVAYNVAVFRDVSGNATGLRVTLLPRALGAKIESGFSLRLPVSASDAVATRRVGAGEATALDVQAQETGLVIPISSNLRELFAAPTGFVNTEAGGAAQGEGSTVVVEISFPRAVRLSLASDPFDFFFFHVETPSREIHRPAFGGTDNMDFSLFGTEDDGSIEGRFFVDTDGLPFLLAIPAPVRWPFERVGVEQLWPAITDFAASGGQSSTDYYLTPNESVAYPANTTLDAPGLDYGACVLPTCVDSARNGDETDVDCGGTCGGCAPGAACQVHADCGSEVCSSGSCTQADVRACAVSNGSGAETRSAGLWSACRAVSCSAGYHVEAGACELDTRACAVANGAGAQTYASGAWGACQVASCESGYLLSANTCTAIAACSGGLPTDGTTTTFSIPAGQVGSRTACGTSGRRWSVSASVGSGCYTLSIRSPTNVQLRSTLYCGAAFTDVFSVDSSGGYTISLDPNNNSAMNGNITVHDVPADATGSVTPGNTANLAITTPGQNYEVTFDGAVGQRVSLAIARSSGCHRAVIVRPNGATLTDLGLSCGRHFSELLTLPEAGTYRLRGDPDGTAIGTYGVSLYDVPADFDVSTSVGGAAVSAQTLAPAHNGQVRFDGAAAQRVSILIERDTGCHHSSLVAPSGAVVLSRSLSCGSRFSELLVLPETGNYRLTLDANDMDLPRYTVSVYAVPLDTMATGSLGGATVRVPTLAPAHNSEVQFAGTSGQRISALISRNTGCAYSTILAPSGATVLARSLSCGTRFSEPLTLTETGTHRVVLDPNSADVPTFDVSLYEIPGDVSRSANIGGGSVSVPVLVPGQLGVVGFSASSGARLTVTLGVSPSFCHTAQVRAPSAATTYSGNLRCGGTSFTFTAGESGAQSLVLDPNGSDTGTFTVTVAAAP